MRIERTCLETFCWYRRKFHLNRISVDRVVKILLAFITTSLAAVKDLTPLVHDLYEKLKAAGIIDW